MNARVALILTVVGLVAADVHADGVRLVLQITVDGLRADLLHRYGDRFGKGGFRHFVRHGVAYADAHYQHANTETIVGHTTLSTGAHPSQHGMVGNAWFDRGSGRLTYNIEDERHPLLPTRPAPAKAVQVDPAQRAARSNGRSPHAILASTFGDELHAHFAGASKIFAVSGKDRGAVAMAGHAGKAFWYSTETGDFVTSAYYYESYPAWVRKWNGARAAETHAGKAWELLHDPTTYLLGGRDDRPYEVDLEGYGRVFPHPFGRPNDGMFFTRLLVSPVGDALLLDFTRALIRAEALGDDDVPDYLAVSFSGVDAVNHFFGPSSLENEDVVLQLDRTLAELLAFVDETIGLARTLIVLSADHGMPEMPEARREAGYLAQRLHPDDIVQRVEALTRGRYGILDPVRYFFRPYLYLHRDRIAASGADPDEVERAIADDLAHMHGIAAAVARSALPTMPDTPLVGPVRRNTHVSRSGDIYVVQEPYWFLFEEGPIAAMHGSPWRYDTHVPILFAGPGITADVVHRRVHPVDVAPTLSAFVGVASPSSAVGVPLVEVLDR